MGSFTYISSWKLSTSDPEDGRIFSQSFTWHFFKINSASLFVTVSDSILWTIKKTHNNNKKNTVGLQATLKLKCFDNRNMFYILQCQVRILPPPITNIFIIR